MAKGDKFYFENFVSSTELAKKAARYLVECFENYDAEKIEEMVRTLHAIEHEADGKKHEMGEALAKAFVTPVDREDLDMLSHQIDNVVDLIEEVLQKFYIYDVKTVNASAIDFAKKIERACDVLARIMAEFENFKKSKQIKPLIIQENDIEEECDDLYLSCMRELTKSGGDILEIVSWRKIFESLEACADACEHAGECVGSVIMKNT